MPRNPRNFVQGIPVHVVQRGHNKKIIFDQDDDFHTYLGNLFIKKRELGVQVLAYCLMSNHVHLVLVPPFETTNVSRLMKILAGRQTRYFNRVHSRSGTLWEGRYKSSPIDSTAYLLACCRYVELNPVRAGMVTQPADYRWSSYRAHAGLEFRPELDQHDELLSLADNPTARARAYRKIVEASDRRCDDFIRAVTKRNQPIGSSEFCANLSQKLGFVISQRGQGRPPGK